MPPNRFDQASRYAAKLDPAGLLAWLFLPEVLSLRFHGWLDTRTLPFPGDPDRTCDTVAWLAWPDGSEPWAVPIEFSLEPDATMFGRLLVYLGRLWLERRPTADSTDRYQVVAIVVNLTSQGQASRDMRLGPARTCLTVVERNLADKDAVNLLASIAARQATRCLLPWVPLMRGGAESAILDQWKVLAEGEPDALRRADYGGLARVFAEAAGRGEIWQQSLRGWNMIESKVVAEWIAEGEAKGMIKGEILAKQQALLRLLVKKFSPAVPADLAASIQACLDSGELSRWFDAALDAATLDDFRRALTS